MSRRHQFGAGQTVVAPFEGLHGNIPRGPYVVVRRLPLIDGEPQYRVRSMVDADTWHLDEVFIRIRGVLHYLWRAVDQHGVVLDILVQDRRNGAAAKRFFKRLLHGLQYKPRRLVTDG